MQKSCINGRYERWIRHVSSRRDSNSVRDHRIFRVLCNFQVSDVVHRTSIYQDAAFLIDNYFRSHGKSDPTGGARVVEFCIDAGIDKSDNAINGADQRGDRQEESCELLGLFYHDFVREIDNMALRKTTLGYRPNVSFMDKLWTWPAHIVEQR
jgi:hypothetical protein